MRQEKSVAGYNNTGLNRQRYVVLNQQDHFDLLGVPMRALLAFFIFAITATSASADPNSICADKASLSKAVDLLKDRTPLGMRIQPMINSLISVKILPSDYTPSDFYRDVHRLGSLGYGNFIAEKAEDAQRKSGREVTEKGRLEMEQIRQNFKGNVQLEPEADMFNNLLVISSPPIAISYDPNLNRVTCTIKYNFDFDRIISYMQRFAPDSQELRITVQTKAIQIATNSYKTGIYTVQPDGRGGTAISILSGP